MRKGMLAGAAVGATVLGAAAIYYFREKATPGPHSNATRLTFSPIYSVFPARSD